jgi:flagellar biosynthesis/type III secretory pathway M-ring protein FliF/YscJ
VQSLVAFLRGLGASRLMAMIAVTAALIGFFAFVIMRVTTPQMTTLFTDLTTEDSSSIIKDLERQAIPLEIRNEGAVIMVPKDRVTRLRMKLAEGGLLSLEEACSRYTLTVDEFLSWQFSIDQHGLAGLRTTRIQQYRQ